MKTKISIITLSFFLVASQAFGGIAGAIQYPDQIAWGGRTVPKSASGFILMCSAAGSSTNKCSFRKPNATSAYTVPNGKSFYFKMMTVINGPGVASAGGVTVGYADADVGYNSSTALTNPIFLGSNSASNGAYVGMPNSVGYLQSVPLNDFAVPAAKIPAMIIQGASADITVILYGVEQ